jgi:hypothetical protein
MASAVREEEKEKRKGSRACSTGDGVVIIIPLPEGPSLAGGPLIPAGGDMVVNRGERWGED